MKIKVGNNKICSTNDILQGKISFSFWHRKLTLKVRILHILTTFTQVTAGLKNCIMCWLLFLGLKEGLVKCATVCIKSWVILTDIFSNISLYSTEQVKVEKWTLLAILLVSLWFQDQSIFKKAFTFIQKNNESLWLHNLRNFMSW